VYGAYVHPILGAIVLALLVYVASLGLRMRTARRGRAELARQHARLAPWAYAGVLLSWLGGLLSSWFLRGDLETASTFHFRTGLLIAALLTGSALTARWLSRGNSRAREIHPWLGAVAALLAAAHAVTGLRIMP
jgi:hypothetical protein